MKKLAIAGILVAVSGLFSPSQIRAEAACDLGSVPPRPANYKLKGGGLLRLNKNEEALSCFKKTLEDKTAAQDPEVWNGLGVSLARLKMFNEAITAYNRAIEIRNGVLIDRGYRQKQRNRLQPQDYYIFWFNKGTALGDLTQNEAALAAIDKSLELKANYGPAWFYRGVYLRRLGRNAEAASAYTKATAFAPQLSYILLYREQVSADDYLFWQGQGLGYGRINRYKDARAAIKRSEEIRQARPDLAATTENYTFYYEGIKFSDEGNPQKALVAFERSTQIKPDFAEGWHAQGNVLNSLGRYKDAIAAYDQALKFDPNLHNSWFERGVSYSRLKQPQQALKSFMTAHKIANNFAEAWHNSARILYDMNRFSEALTAFDAAIAGEPLRGGVERYESFFGKSVTLLALRRYPEAIAATDTTLRLNPGFKPALALRQRLKSLN